MHKILGVIPARLGSTRLQRKPLHLIGDKTLVQHVWEQALKSQKITDLFVATDSDEIADCVNSFGGRVIMTSIDCKTGSDRVAEVSDKLKNSGYDIVVNIQGDMPFIAPKLIDSTIDLLINDLDFDMSTLSTPIIDEQEFDRPHSVKVAIGSNARALYFSRAPIPHWRDKPEFPAITLNNPYGYKHIGLYVFRPKTLELMKNLESIQVETRESLEQLRLLGNGVKIKVNIAHPDDLGPNIEVDTAEDLEKARKIIK